MQAKKRYGLIISLVCSLTFLFFILDTPSSESPKLDSRFYYLSPDVASSFIDYRLDMADDPNLEYGTQNTPCSMSNCFNFTRCEGRAFKVHIYPQTTVPPSEAYNKILSAVRFSRYYTPDPEEACLFVLSYDTLDRDKLSGDYVKNMQSKINKLPQVLWDKGRNHIIFNMYHGSWPDYQVTDLNFDPDMAMMARASTSTQLYRPEFDISLPLFHKELPLREIGNENVGLKLNHPTKGGYLLVFKGKRYVHGIGSETRNSLYHLHNGRDVVMLTTCKHGKTWKQMQDERCNEDNSQYDKWDYDSLMINATFCLVPRGRRLGSFRFLESLKRGCIPVVLSDDWELPFSEVIDWSQAVFRVDERLLLQIPEMLRLIPESRIISMKQQCRRLFKLYFSNVEKIVFTALEIIHDRIERWRGRDARVWNSGGGVLSHFPTFSGDLNEFPFFSSAIRDPHFTAVIYAGSRFFDSAAQPSPLLKLIGNVAKSKYCRKILLLWANDRSIPKLSRWPAGKVILQIIDVKEKGLSARIIPYREIQTPAIFSIDDRISLSTDEIDFAMEVWRWFPSRIVGYFSRTLIWDQNRNHLRYSSKHLSHYSLVLQDAAVYHRYYNYLFSSWPSPSVKRVLEEAPECQDLILNLMSLEFTGRAPIKLSTRTMGHKSGQLFKTRQMCWDSFVSLLGPFHMERTKVRMDPVLYKDPVSNLRKKYRKMEN